jgi:hypothetical protein
MGNSAQPISTTLLPGAYLDPGVRMLRQLQTYNFPQTVTSTTVVATANSIPQRSSGDEIFSWNFTPYSTNSIIEVEIQTNICPSASSNFWVALFNDYSNDAMAVLPCSNTAAAAAFTTFPVIFKHYFQPQATVSTRYSLRAANASTISLIFNYFAYGGRNASRITMKEWSSPSLTNT